MTAKWREEKAALKENTGLKEKLDAARNDLEIAQRKGDLARAGRDCLWRHPGP